MSVGRQGSINIPTRAVCAPGAPTISLSFAPFGQFPVAHRPSVPCWLAGGSRAVSTLLVRPGLPSSNRLLGPARPTSKRASLGPRPAVRIPAPVPGSRRQAAPHHRPPAAFTAIWARAPDERPPPRRRVRPRPIPTQARVSATGGFEHRLTSRSLPGISRTSDQSLATRGGATCLVYSGLQQQDTGTHVTHGNSPCLAPPGLAAEAGQHGAHRAITLSK